MKSKLIVITWVSMMILNLFACGQTIGEDPAQISDTTVVEEVTNEETSETEEVVEVVKNVEEAEPTEEPIVVEEEPFTEEDALAKVKLLIEAYNELARSEKEVEWCILDRCEKLRNVGSINVKTADGYALNNTDNSPYGVAASTYVAINYFYNFINNNTNYYDFTEYIQENNLEDIVCENINNNFEHEVNIGDTNDSLLGSALALANYLKQFDNIEITEFVEGENCTTNPVSGIDVYYEAKLVCDNEDIGLKALFDENGNFINIYWPDDSEDVRVFTFPE